MATMCARQLPPFQPRDASHVMMSRSVRRPSRRERTGAFDPCRDRRPDRGAAPWRDQLRVELGTVRQHHLVPRGSNPYRCRRATRLVSPHRRWRSRDRPSRAGSYASTEWVAIVSSSAWFATRPRPLPESRATPPVHRRIAPSAGHHENVTAAPEQAALGCIVGPERRAEAFRSPAEGDAAPSRCRSILREAVERRERASRKPDVARVSMPIASRRIVTGMPHPASTGSVASRCRSSGARAAHGGAVRGSASVRPIARSRWPRQQPAHPDHAGAAGAAFARPLGQAAPAQSMMPRQIPRPVRLAALAAANRGSAGVERSRRGTQQRESLAICVSPPRPSRNAGRCRSPFILAATVRARPGRALDQGRWVRARWPARGRTAVRLAEVSTPNWC